MRILIAEEDRDLINSLKRHLEYTGYAIDCAYDGVQALSYVNENEYDCIVIDTKLSRIPGYKVLETINNNNNNKTCPILALLSLNESDNSILSLNIGISDCITTPFFVSYFDFLLNQILTNKTKSDFSIGNVLISPSTFSMHNLNSSLHLTSREIVCLELFKNSNLGIVDINQLEIVLNNNSNTKNSWIYIDSLNKKFKMINSPIRIIKYKKEGYKLVDNYD